MVGATTPYVPGKTKREKMLVFGLPRIDDDEIEEVEQTLRSGWLGTGPKVHRFENLFREYTGAAHAMALNSCTAALHLAMVSAGVKAGDEVITTPMTFCATANAVIHAGAKPVFVDVDRTTMNIDPERVERAVTPKTRAILPVHFAGRPCDMDAILDIARRRGLLVVEDAAHCIEGVYRGRKVGAIGDVTCFSFYVTKNITTAEGGMATTRREDLADKIKMYGLHGMSRDAWKRYSDSGYVQYDVVFPGFKYNMTDLQASLGIHQMARIDRWWLRRQEVWRRYDEAFADLPVIRPAPPEPDTRHARHLYTLLVDNKEAKISRDDFQRELFERRIGTGIHFKSLHLHEYYRNAFDHHRGDFPNAEYISDRTISLPLSAAMSEEDVQDVIDAVREALLHGNR